jgi:hypothetical protein
MYIYIYLDGINRTRGPFVMFMGQRSANKRSLAKVRRDLYFISAFCVTPAELKYATLSLFTVVASDNSILCFRRKVFLKSDMLAGFTTSVALICSLACVI